jgi:hypothetical protein
VFEKRLKVDERLAQQVCPSCGRRGAVLVMSAPAKVGAGAAESSGPVCRSTGQACGCGHGLLN